MTDIAHPGHFGSLLHDRALHDPRYQAYQILHVAFVAAPVIAGLDKFLQLLIHWERYLSPLVARLSPLSTHGTMLVVGVVEMAAGLVVAVRPRVGAYVVAAWLLGIIVNLIAVGGYLDVALRDFGLLLAALALGRLSFGAKRVKNVSWTRVRVYTVGHSTRTLDELVALLRGFEIATVADIRTVPRSRHNPQFNGDSLPGALRPSGVRYAHVPRLGGLRRARPDSLNVAWLNASFRGFADYMLTEDFEGGLMQLRALAIEGRVALMCAEAVPWRCHRSLIADALVTRGARVEHIITSVARPIVHRLRSFASVSGTQVTYPG